MGLIGDTGATGPTGPPGTPAAVTSSFESSLLTITNSQVTVIPHSLGVIPTIVELYLVCTSPELGYSAGEIVKVDNTIQSAFFGASVILHDANSASVAVYKDGIGVYSRLSSLVGFNLNIDNSKWRLKLVLYS